MPTYEYECGECDHGFEAFHSMSSEPLVDCPRCGRPKLIKLIGMGLSPIIEGTKNKCTGGRVLPKKDKLGEGKFKAEQPWWRDGKVDKRILKNPEKYIREGTID
ncbi:hypothetical protein LCGC14_0142110 [marine sediment metagenome]|uniref:Putative regulatory protein FmdB zinc ribbon domain-containing protein n=1 Tax=marine sediment metagenome TaxID=412755 RepID=A0A0F9XIF0_9ZZZZ